MKRYSPRLSKLESYDRRFVIRTIIGLCVALGLILALDGAILVIQRQQIEQESDTAALVGASGEQRTRSQRVALLSLALLNVQSELVREKTQKALNDELDGMESTQQALIAGDPLSGIRSEKTEAVRGIFFEKGGLEGKLRKFVEVARGLARADASNLTLKNPQFFSVTEQSSDLLSGFGQLKQQYKIEGIEGTEHLLTLANRAFLVMSAAILSVAFFVFLPMIRRLKIEFFTRSQTQRELEDQNKELEQFASIIAHDLKAPLNNIGGFSQFLKSKLVNQNDSEALELMGHIEQGVIRMGQMITELLQYARLTRKERRFDRVSLQGVIDKVLKDFESRILELKANVVISKLPTIRGDALLFEHLFQNLLSNALKYRDPSRDPKIEIFSFTSESEDQTVSTIVVQDNGRGFPVGAEERMFEPFRRLTLHQDTEGSGFGLALCKKIMRRHNGSISVEHVPSGGARFLLAFPES